MGDTRVPQRNEPQLPKRLAARRVPQQQRSAAIVDAIIEAGTRVLVQERWSGLTMQAVSRTAGVSPGSLYQYFADKESLVTEIIERISKIEMENGLSIVEAIDPKASVCDALVELIRKSFAFQKTHQAILEATLEALPYLGRYPRLAARSQRIAREVVDWMHRKTGWPADECQLVTHVIVNAVSALTHDGVLGRNPAISLERLERETILLVRGYLRERSVPR